MTWKLSAKSEERLRGVHPDLIKVCREALKISPIDFGIPQYGGLRSEADQVGLFAKGVSKCDGICNLSYHQSGKALDFYAYVDGAASWDKLHLALVAASFLQAASKLGIKLEWGGIWKSFKDYPHVQLPK